MKYLSEKRDSRGRLLSRQVGDILTEFSPIEVPEIPLKMVDTRSLEDVELYDVRATLDDGSEVTLVKANVRDRTYTTSDLSSTASVSQVVVTTYRLDRRQMWNTQHTFDGYGKPVAKIQTTVSAGTGIAVKKETSKATDACGRAVKARSVFTPTILEGGMTPEVVLEVLLGINETDGSAIYRTTNETTGAVCVQQLDVNGYLIKEATEEVTYGPKNTTDGTRHTVQTITFLKYEGEIGGRPSGPEIARRTFGGYQPYADSIAEITEAVAKSRNMPLLSESIGPTFDRGQWNGTIENSTLRTVFSETGDALGQRPSAAIHNCFGFLDEETIGNYRIYYDHRSSFAVPLDERVAEAIRSRGVNIKSGRININNGRIIETYRLHEWQAENGHGRARAEIDMWHYAAMPDGQMARDGRDDTRILSASQGLVCRVLRGPNTPRDAQHRAYVLHSVNGEIVGNRTWFAFNDGVDLSVLYEDWNASFNPKTHDLTFRRDHIA